MDEVLVAKMREMMATVSGPSSAASRRLRRRIGPRNATARKTVALASFGCRGGAFGLDAGVKEALLQLPRSRQA